MRSRPVHRLRRRVLEVREGDLVLRRERMPDATLELRAPDTYALTVLADIEAYTFPMLVTIRRDAAGAPTGFVVSHSRIRGLAFRKQSKEDA